MLILHRFLEMYMPVELLKYSQPSSLVWVCMCVCVCNTSMQGQVLPLQVFKWEVVRRG